MNLTELLNGERDTLLENNDDVVKKHAMSTI
jgi:hypothetical protein